MDETSPKQQNIKKGSRVRVVRNTVGAPTPDHSRRLEPGDELIVVKVSTKKPAILYSDNLGSGWYFPIEDLELIEEGCTCDIITLFNVGCICGEMERERNKR